MRSLSVSLGLAVALAVMSMANVAVAQSQLPACQGAQTSCFDIYMYSDGRKYVGEWRDNKFHGQGTLTFPSGQKYVGEFKDDKFHGQGTMTYADGRVESGTWSDDKFQPTEQQKAQAQERQAQELQKYAAWQAQVQRQAQERQAQERQAQERQAQELQKYAARPKTVLEQVLNYTTTGKEGGDLKDIYWVSGKDGTHKCVMTPKEGSSLSGLVAALYGLNFFKTVDLRQINPDGFRIKTGNRDGSRSNWSVGDENIQIPRDQGTVMERLQKAWGLALAECPPAVRKPF